MLTMRRPVVPVVPAGKSSRRGGSRLRPKGETDWTWPGIPCLRVLAPIRQDRGQLTGHCLANLVGDLTNRRQHGIARHLLARHGVLDLAPDEPGVVTVRGRAPAEAVIDDKRLIDRVAKRIDRCALRPPGWPRRARSAPGYCRTLCRWLIWRWEPNSIRADEPRH